MGHNVGNPVDEEEDDDDDDDDDGVEMIETLAVVISIFIESAFVVVDAILRAVSPPEKNL